MEREKGIKLGRKRGRGKGWRIVSTTLPIRKREKGAGRRWASLIDRRRITFGSDFTQRD